MIELVVQRTPTVLGATFGQLSAEQTGVLVTDVRRRTPICLTLEDAIRAPGVKVPGQTCIPPGRYRLRLITSPKFGPDTPSLDDVPGFTAIRIHAGNVIEDTEGCLVVGDTRSRLVATRPWIGRSRIALARFVHLLKAWFVVQDDMYVRVENPEVMPYGIYADEGDRANQ